MQFHTAYFGFQFAIVSRRSSRLIRTSIITLYYFKFTSRITIQMDSSNLRKFPINTSPRAVQDYFDCLHAWCLLHNFKEDSVSVHFVNAFDREIYRLLKNFEYPDKPILSRCKALNRLLKGYFCATSSETHKKHSSTN